MTNQEHPRTVCDGCGTVLDEPTNTPAVDRLPCPECGSKDRIFRVVLTSAVGATDSLKATLHNEESGATQVIEPELASSLVTAFDPTVSVGDANRSSIEDLPTEVYATSFEISITLLPDPNDATGPLVADIGLPGQEVALGIGNPDDVIIAIAEWLSELVSRYYEKRTLDDQ